MLKAKALFAVKENENTEQKPIAPAANNPGQNPAADPEQTTAAAEQEKKSAALAARLPYDLLDKVVQLIRERVPQVRRVVYDLTPSSNYKAVEWR